MRRLATTLRTARSFASAQTTPRIAICGAGVSGLTLAGILSNGTRDVQVTVFERARRDRDQGYGLDLDEHGQEALVRAGVYDRYWDISYPYSDTAVGYQAIMFARKEEFHVERLKPPMNTRKMVDARGRGPFDCAPRRPGAFRLSPLHAIAATRPKRRGGLPGDESLTLVGAVPRGEVRGQALRGAHEGLVRVGAQARRRRDL